MEEIIMLAKCADQPDREENSGLNPALKFSFLVQLVTLVLIALDWLLQQFSVQLLVVGAHTIVAIAAFCSARAVWRYHRQTVIPQLTNLTLAMGHQPNDIGPYNVFAYLASAWFFVAIGYGAHIAMLLGFIR